MRRRMLRAVLRLLLMPTLLERLEAGAVPHATALAAVLHSAQGVPMNWQNIPRDDKVVPRVPKQ